MVLPVIARAPFASFRESRAGASELADESGEWRVIAIALDDDREWL